MKIFCCLLLVKADFIGRASGRGPLAEGTKNCSSYYDLARGATRLSHTQTKPQPEVTVRASEAPNRSFTSLKCSAPWQIQA